MQTYIISNAKQCFTGYMYWLVIFLRPKGLNTMLCHMGFYVSFLSSTHSPSFHSFLSPVFPSFFVVVVANTQKLNSLGSSGPLHCGLLGLQNSSPSSAEGSSGELLMESFTHCLPGSSWNMGALSVLLNTKSSAPLMGLEHCWWSVNIYWIN